MKTLALALLFLAASVAGLAGTLFKDAEKSLVVAVSSQVAPDYLRTKNPKGGWKPERYVIANGDRLPGTVRDVSFDGVAYPEIAGVVARHLAAHQYYLAKQAKDADLLLAIYWGQTVPADSINYGVAVDQLANVVRDAGPQPSIAERMLNTGVKPDRDNTRPTRNSNGIEFSLARIEMENRNRDLASTDNARILGYLDPINEARWRVVGGDVGDLKQDLMNDVEEGRYYVVVAAYDFKEVQQSGRKTPRWVTRISISSRGERFDERMAQMIASAATSFGQNTGFKRHYYGDPRIELGETEYLGMAAPAAAQSQLGKN